MTNTRSVVLSLVLIAGAMLGACGGDTGGKPAAAKPETSANPTVQPQTQPAKTPETPAPSAAPQSDPLAKLSTATPQTSEAPSTMAGQTAPDPAKVQAAAVTPPVQGAPAAAPDQSPASTGAQPAPAKPAAAPAPAPTSSASGDQMTLLIFLAAAAAILAVIAIVAVLMASSMFAWRRRLPDGQVSIVPEKVMAMSDTLAKANVQQIEWTQDAVAAIKEDVDRFGANLQGGVEGFKSDVSEINKAFAVFAATAADKDAQIKRLREGSDKQVYRQFFRHFIKVLRYVEADVAEVRAKGGDVVALESIRTYLMEALAESGLETFSPPEGEDYRKRNDIADGPKTVATDDPARDWTISRTLQPGFRMPTGADPVVIEKAVVEIYRLKA